MAENVLGPQVQKGIESMSTLRTINTIAEFVPLLVRSELVAEAEVARLLKEYRAEYLPSRRVPDTITAWCTFLTATGSLTPWQCERLRNGQWKGFVLDDYLLLDRLGFDESHSFYFARERSTNAWVRLSICVPRPGGSSGLEFTVDHVYE
jgi:hypothetical protein